MIDFLILAAEAAPTPAAGPGDGGMWQILITFAPMVLIFYFLIIRPESKRRKEKEALIAAVKPKDEVVTIFGLYGTVTKIDGDDVELLVDSKKDVKMRFRRAAIDSIVVSAGAPKDEKK